MINNSNCNSKCVALIALILSAILLCIYYLQQRSQYNFTEYMKGIHTIFVYQHNNFTEIQTNQPIEFIKNVLEKEYNQTDLISFYNLVQDEYSFGLKCARKPIPTTTVSNSTITNSIINQTKIISTNIRSSVSSSINSVKRSFYRSFRRSALNTFIINNSDICSNELVDLVIIIISKSENYKARDSIRRTWGSGKDLGIYSSLNVKYLFLIDFDEKLMNNIRLEDDIFHDIIQVELLQQYTLVTQRVLALIEWSFRYCRTGKYIFKTDDDIFINVKSLFKFLSPLIQQSTDDSFITSQMNIYGYQHINAQVYRQSTDSVGTRYVVTLDEYPCELYPTFLSGFGYLIPKKARDAILYAAYQDVDPFRISDVYFTGIIPDYLSIARQPLSNYRIRFEGDCDNFFNDSTAFACAGSNHHGQTVDTFPKFNSYWQTVKRFND